MDLLGDTSGFLGLIKIFLLGGFMGAVFGVLLKIGELREKSKNQKFKKKEN